MDFLNCERQEPCCDCNCQTGTARVAVSHAEKADDQSARQQC